MGECIPKVYQKIQNSLVHSDINASCSGSTLVNVMVEGDEVICANVGDSRAILARQSKSNFTQSTARAGNSSTFPKTTNPVLKLKRSGCFAMGGEFMPLKMKLASR